MLLKCREPNFKLIITEKIFSNELDEFCSPIFIENKYELKAILYSKNSTPVIKTDNSTELTTVTYSGHIIDNIVSSTIYNKEIEYEMITSNCESSNIQKGKGYIVPLAQTSNKTIKKYFGTPISLVIRINLG